MESIFSLMTDEGVENTETDDIICWYNDDVDNNSHGIVHEDHHDGGGKDNKLMTLMIMTLMITLKMLMKYLGLPNKISRGRSQGPGAEGCR